MSPRASLMAVPYVSSGGEHWYLEAEFLPAEQPSQELVLVCHPHPLFGGEMHNNVVETLYRGLSDEYCTARFNFSGVGGSDGNHENGEGEIRQVQAVVGHLCGEFTQEQACAPWSRVHVVGYSFGAAMAVPAALAMETVTSCVAIAFPFDMFHGIAESSARLQSKRRLPMLFVTGDRDDFTPIPAFSRWAGEFVGAERIVVDGADHFWGGLERRLVAEVRKFLNGPRQDRS